MVEEGDPDKDEVPEEGPYTKTSGVEEAKFIPPPPLEPPPVIPAPLMRPHMSTFHPFRRVDHSTIWIIFYP